ncbi:MAG: glycosyltransferase family 9 protein, partial [Flavobacteriia bacterium]
MRSTAPKKILVVRFSSIGDIVLTFPVVSAIKSLFPECQVDFATKKQFATLLEACPQIDQVFLLQDSLTALRQQIDFKHYDAIFDLHHNLRTRLLLFASRVPVYRFPKNNIEKWLLTSFSVVPKQRKHVIERYLEPLRQIAPSFAPFHAKLEYIIPKMPLLVIGKRFELIKKTNIAGAIGPQFAPKRY